MHDSNQNPGRRICTILREMRVLLAKANHISYSPVECTFTGACAGTCPACEAELARLNAQLAALPHPVYPNYPLPARFDPTPPDTAFPPDEEDLFGFFPILELLGPKADNDPKEVPLHE